MEVVVITKDGFMTHKKPEEVLSTDEVLYKGNPRECNNFIHSIKPDQHDR
mgnify:CR=1 FL=1|jgi:hypothetical protein|tara:strand:+ start:449 stop:598 length:150 start_codon:yes stop_codon:yes gene_type:complete